LQSGKRNYRQGYIDQQRNAAIAEQVFHVDLRPRWVRGEATLRTWRGYLNR
jgi:hypothetical protein